jgi:hypothetical protein
MSTPRTPFPRSEEKVSPISPHAEIPIAKLDRKDLLGKKMYDHQGNFLGKVVSVIKDDAGEILSVTRYGNQGSSRSSQPSEHQA